MAQDPVQGQRVDPIAHTDTIRAGLRPAQYSMAALDRDRATQPKSFDATIEPGNTHRELGVPCAEAVLV